MEKKFKQKKLKDSTILEAISDLKKIDYSVLEELGIDSEDVGILELDIIKHRDSSTIVEAFLNLGYTLEEFLLFIEEEISNEKDAKELIDVAELLEDRWFI